MAGVLRGWCAVPVPMSEHTASLTRQESMSWAVPPCAESPQTHYICSVWPRQHIQFSTICWARTYAPQKGHRHLHLTHKHSNGTVKKRNHHCHALMWPEPLAECVKNRHCKWRPASKVHVESTKFY